ncbi:Uma2 family endonuclease [Saccharothrix sp. S26]|uniref:Uma2 family endonuclease n=1 Tax=Saccharothrix sp. S26 TaxID=2907215 RepID=UPI001F48D1AB|nr:Uma2 family endonuclease [Saccharothrix sp. S26]MCE6994504.1 Uma2 family endonuclease [Saccharothrix sp. S26]
MIDATPRSRSPVITAQLTEPHYGEDMADLPDWMRPPREEGWFAEDLDRLPEAPRHTELIDGALVFMMAPQRSWHMRLIDGLTSALRTQAPANFEVSREMTVRLDARNRPEADVIVSSTSFDPDRTWFEASDVLLAVEVVSPESAFRDRTVKLRKYAAAGIRHHWLVEDEAVGPVVHVYELDEPTKAYVATGVFRDSLHVTVPFEIDVDLAKLVP